METPEPRARIIEDPTRLAAYGLIIALLSVMSAFGLNKVLERFLALPDGASVEETRVAEKEEPSTPAGASGSQETEPSSASTAPILARTGKVPIASKRSFIDPILKRNIFDSTAVGLLSAEATGAAQGDGRRTDLKVTLVATVVAEPEQFSSCLISAEEKQRGCTVCGYGIGDDLLGEAKILRIEQKKVFIRRTDGAIEYLDMEGESSLKPKTAAATDASAESAEGVTKTGDNSYQVDASLVADALSNIDQLANQVRAIPHRGPDGEIDGFRLSAIRRGSLLNKLGIKNGDIIHSVNGSALNSASAAMGAYQQFGSEKNFTFEVTRRNQKQSLNYEIR